VALTWESSISLRKLDCSCPRPITFRDGLRHGKPAFFHARLVAEKGGASLRDVAAAGVTPDVAQAYGGTLWLAVR
jgi:hypothetical protein